MPSRMRSASARLAGSSGSSWPAMRHSFGVPVGALGLILLINTIGSVVVAAFVGRLIQRMGTAALLAVAACCAARSVRMRTTSGDVHFEGRLARGAEFDAQTVSGDLKVRAGFEDGLTYEAATVTGDINDCFNAEAEHSKYGPGNKLNGSRGGGSAHVRLKTMSGEIDLCDRK